MKVEANESVVFIMNDDFNQIHGVGTTDNEGSITVSWRCKDCNE